MKRDRKGERKMAKRKHFAIKKELHISDAEAGKMIKSVMEDGLLLWINCHAWGNRKKVDHELLKEKFGADDAERLRAVRDLIETAPVKAITKEMDDAKGFAVKQSMPWFHGGSFWIHRDRVASVDEKLLAARMKIKGELRASLREQYPGLVKDSLEKHPNLYKANDFPPVDYVVNSFGLEWGWQKVILPMNGEVSVVGKDVVDRENKKFQDNIKAAGEEFIKATRASLIEMLVYLRDTLKDPTKKFHDSTVEKPKEFLAKLADMKVPFHDKPFAEISGDLKDVLEGVFGQDLRDDVEYRKAIAGVMEDVVKVFEEMPTVQIDRAVDW
jgi:hypothetical protein